MKSIRISDREIGLNHPPYIIAELSANHNGSLEKALKTIEMAKKMGADAIKLQTYTPDTMTIDCGKEDFQIHSGLWDGYRLYDLYKEAHTPFEWHKQLFEKANEVGIVCFSTPFDESAVDLLEDLNAPAYKIASFEIVDLPLLKYVAQTGKPMLISTGMANLDEISDAVNTVRTAGCDDIVLLHCISSYPAPVDQSNLSTILDLASRFDVVPGLSDHTTGTIVPIAGISLGACVIEKHVTLSRKDKGSDHMFSLEPNELKHLCEGAKDAWTAIGTIGYEQKASEIENLQYRRSIYVVEDIRVGEKLTTKNIRRIRPGYGMPPKYFEKILGKKVSVDIDRGTALSWGHIE